MICISRFLAVFVALVCISSTLLAAEPKTTFKPETFEDLPSAIKAWTTTMKEKNYEAMLDVAVPPKVLETMLAAGKTRESLLKEFTDKQSQEALKLFEGIATAEPQYNEEKTKATIEYKEGDGPVSKVHFERIEKKWYMTTVSRKVTTQKTSLD